MPAAEPPATREALCPMEMSSSALNLQGHLPSGVEMASCPPPHVPDRVLLLITQQTWGQGVNPGLPRTQLCHGRHDPVGKILTKVFRSDGWPLAPLVPGRQRVLGRGWESVSATSVWRAQNVAYV